MMKINNKGFMMAEIIIVSTIIIGTLVGLYTIFNKLYINYKERSYYYNIDTVYVLKTIYDELIETIQTPSLVGDETTQTNQMNTLASMVENSAINYIEFETSENSQSDNLVTLSYGVNTINKSLVEQYGINNLFIVKYDEKSIDHIINNVNNALNTTENTKYTKSLKEYLIFLKNTLPNLNKEQETSPVATAVILPLIVKFPDDYLYFGIDTSVKYKYMFIIEFKDENNNYYYGNYRIG